MESSEKIILEMQTNSVNRCPCDSSLVLMLLQAVGPIVKSIM